MDGPDLLADLLAAAGWVGGLLESLGLSAAEGPAELLAAAAGRVGGLFLGLPETKHSQGSSSAAESPAEGKGGAGFDGCFGGSCASGPFRQISM